MEKLDDMFIKGQYTPFDQVHVPRKHPLSDSTNAEKPAKKRRVQARSSK